MRRVFLAIVGVLLLGSGPRAVAADLPERPNIVFILADDLGYGDLGCFGQEIVQTPNIDRLAAGGMRFTDFYAGSTVCAPSRCVLMTGRHTGHCSVRGNAGDSPAQTLLPSDRTVAELLKDAGYRTALIGKWGLGNPDFGGLPNDEGFDRFYGYLNQRHAHNYWPEFLWKNTERVRLRNELDPAAPESFAPGGVASVKKDYSHDLFVEEALGFLDRVGDEPFFLYLPLTIPHANNEANRYLSNGSEVPDFGIYRNRDWPDPDKGFAAMITRMDEGIGRIRARIERLGLADRTLIVFTSDNGPHDEASHTLERFGSSGPLQGIKRALYEGGIRVPTIAYWPGVVAPGTQSDHIGYFGDLYATAAELIGEQTPADLDSVSLVPTLVGEPDRQGEHDALYWEFYEQGSRQAVRVGKWKAIREPMLTGAVELFDLHADIGETTDLAAQKPDVLGRMIKVMDREHVPDERWKPRGRPTRRQPSPDRS